jgi:hypothetical protein
MANACGNCTHWNASDDDWLFTSAGMGKCEAIPEYWELTERINYDEVEDYDKAQSDALRTSKAVVRDGSRYRADLMTAPDFCCCLHRPKAP